MALPITPGTYGIDTMHSQLGFAVTHLGISTVRGTFDSFTGSFTVGDDLAGSSIAIEVAMTSINSGNRMRDEHMFGADFFDTPNHPTMTFTSTSITADGDGYSLTGDLSIKGVTLPVTFSAAYNGSSVFPMDQSTHFGFAATGAISRSAYGISYGVPMVSDQVKLSLDVQFFAPAAA